MRNLRDVDDRRVEVLGPAADDAAWERLETVARLMDRAFTIPGTGIRFGLDNLIGLVPGIGDAVGAVVSLWVVAEARRLGAPKTLVARMLANVAIDGLAGSVPLVGDIFDVAFKANIRNLELLRQHRSRR